MDAQLYSLTPLDMAALGILGVCYGGYSLSVRYPPKTAVSLRHVMHLWRIQWLKALCARETRIMDTQLIGHVMYSITFFANSSILILAGLVAAFGASEAAAAQLSTLFFVAPLTPDQFALRLGLPVIFITLAFFVLTTSMRQFNYACVLIGAAPDHTGHMGQGVPAGTHTGQEQNDRFISTTADILGLATNNFNKGIRLYYFAMASLSWFVHPVALGVSAPLITLFLYQRQFYSPTVRALARIQS